MENKISIIIPVYNVENYLEECLNSVINQTYKNLEIICINSNSQDNSIKILQEYARNDSRIIVLNLENNSGQGIARNKALEIAQGEYIMFLDSDDWLELDACEVAYNKISQGKYDFVRFAHYTHNEKTKKPQTMWNE